MSRTELARKIQETAIDGRLPCARAFALAEKLGVSLAEIGALCNELGIKIIACQLGCF